MGFTPIGREHSIVDILDSHYDVLQISRERATHIASILVRNEIYSLGDLYRYVEDGFLLENTPGIRVSGAIALKRLLSLEQQPVQKISITTPGVPLDEKVKLATASVAPDMREIAKQQFRNGAVIIEP